MTPDDLCKSGKEAGEQAALFAWANCAAQYGFEWADDNMAYSVTTRNSLSWKSPSYKIPSLDRLFAIHNQGHGDAIRGARAKAEGVKAGVPDLMLPVPANGQGGLFIELKQRKYKSAKSGGTSEEQKDWINFLIMAQYRVRVAYGWREAANYLREYLQGVNVSRKLMLT